MTSTTPQPGRAKRARKQPPKAAGETVQHIELAAIVTGLNNRTVFKQADLEELAESMREHGLAQPITVRPNPGGAGYQLVAGERRMRAAKLLQWETIPALVRELSDQQARAIVLIENTQRKDVDPIDEASGYHAYMAEFGVDVPAVAQATGHPTQRIYRRLELLKLRADVQERLRKDPSLLSYCELMVQLDVNRQALAFRVLTSRSKPPTLAEFRRAVTDLREAQDKEDGTQAALFTAEEIADLWVEKMVESEKTGKRARRARLPVDERFPPPDVKARNQWLPNQAKTWADQLRDAGFEEAAAAILTFFEATIAEGRLEADESQWPEYFV